MPIFTSNKFNPVVFIIVFVVAALVTSPALGQWNQNGGTLWTNNSVGIGTNQANSLLSFGWPNSPSARQIGLWDNPGNWYGLGMGNTLLRLQVGWPTARFGFFVMDNDEVASISKNVLSLNGGDASNSSIWTAWPAYQLNNGNGIDPNANNEGILGALEFRKHFSTITSSRIYAYHRKEYSYHSSEIRFSFQIPNFNGQLYDRLAIRWDGKMGIGAVNFDEGLNLGADAWGNGHNLKFLSSNRGIVFYGGGERIVGTSDYGIEFQTQGNTPRLKIRNDGNVGIGTDNTGSFRLAVEGKIGARNEVTVLNPGVAWPDYVFAPGYKLRTLPETEAYIKANGHLPEVPSAGQIEKEGLNLSEMNATLLKKIEELTLHIIQLQKRIEVLENR